MPKTLLCVFVLLAFAFTVQGQVTVELLLEQDHFIRDESLPVKVRISNRSGQTLKLGEDEDWLTFNVESRDGYPVRRFGETPVREPFILESASAATRKVDIMPYFSVSRPGRYVVTATVKIKDWGEHVVSSPRMFDVVTGQKIWEQEFGVPARAGSPEVRKYTLQQANYIKRRMLYLRLTDDKDTQVFRVVPVGPLVSFSKPEAQLDRDSNLHVLFQTGARAFYYVVISPNGELLTRETHEYTNTRPVLRAADLGRIMVAGGVRRRAIDDFPVATADATNAESAKP